MEYKVREGIALLDVCGTHFLAPTHKAFEACPNITRITFLDVIFWKKLSEGAKVEDLCEFYATLSFKQPEEVRPKVESRLERLSEQGFLIPFDDPVFF